MHSTPSAGPRRPKGDSGGPRAPLTLCSPLYELKGGPSSGRGKQSLAHAAAFTAWRLPFRMNRSKQRSQT